MEEASEMKEEEKWVYRISGEAEWEELQNKGFTHGGDLDRTTGCIHLSDLNQVKMTLENFFAGRKDLYLLQIDVAKLWLQLWHKAQIKQRTQRTLNGVAWLPNWILGMVPSVTLLVSINIMTGTCKLGEGLVYESADGTNYFPHFYGPERSFVPLQIDTVVKAEKVDLIDGNFNLPTHTPAAALAAATAAATTTTGNPFSCFLYDDIPWDYANDDIDYDRFFGNNNDNDDDYDEFRYSDCENFGFEGYSSP